jgi:transposase-like protein
MSSGGRPAITAGHHREISERLLQRNGYRNGSAATRGGAVELRIPQAQEGQLLPRLPEPRRKALTAATQEAYLQGPDHHLPLLGRGLPQRE